MKCDQTKQQTHFDGTVFTESRRASGNTTLDNVYPREYRLIWINPDMIQKLIDSQETLSDNGMETKR